MQFDKWNKLKKEIDVKFILFDIVTPKWVLFFKDIIKKLDNVIVTTRGDKEYSETIKLNY